VKQTPAPVEFAEEESEGWAIRSGELSLREPLIMGILNVTPDSFSDGGRFHEPELALRHAEQMIAEGADLIDVGGESTRPGAEPLNPDQEMERVLPVVRLLSAELDVVISVDTRRASVASAALLEGAHLVNDVSALGDPEMASVVAAQRAGLVLMHMRGTPQTMQSRAEYVDVVSEVASELEQRLALADAAGIPRSRVVVDPGIGFAKRAEHNLQLLGRLSELRRLGRPILLGVSRKAFLGSLLGDIPPEERAVGTAAACVAGLLGGARIFRVHDVRPVRQALSVAEAIREASEASQ